MRLSIGFVGLACASVAGACALFPSFADLSGDAQEGPEGGPGDEAGLLDSSDDSRSTACDAGAATYRDFSDSTNWSTFDLWSMAGYPGNAGPTWFIGGAFDDRYVYFVPRSEDPSYGGMAIRYDTTKAFKDPASWESFAVGGLGTNEKGFGGSLFDGKHVYFTPNDATNIAYYDVSKPFAAATSWTTYDMTQVGAARAIGGVFDGRYLYMAPGGPYNARALKFDALRPMSDTNAWVHFDMSELDAGSLFFFGTTYDGRYVYFAPCGDANGARGLAIRYDTTGAFGAATGWQSIDLTTVSPLGKGFNGAVFDGRYVYYVPQLDYLLPGGGPGSGTLLRYDTTMPFDSAGSWVPFDMTGLDKRASKFSGAVFDGRYILFIAASDTLNLRYDTQGKLTEASSWSSFDTQMLTPAPAGSAGGVFDGHYIYLSPSGSGNGRVVTRFEAKTPASLPCIPGYGASTF